MPFRNASFITSAASKEGWVNDNKKEVCFVGKSNVGKSTLINNLVGQNKLAKTSKTPGCTKLLNFFDIDNRFRIVDAPGYGYAKTARRTYDSFEKIMADYLYDRENLSLILLLVDSRHIPTDLDKEMYDLLLATNRNFLVVATKADQLNQSLRSKCKKKIMEKFLKIKENQIVLVSDKDKKSIESLIDIIEEVISRE